MEMQPALSYEFLIAVTFGMDKHFGQEKKKSHPSSSSA